MELITLGSIMSMKKGKKPKVMSRVNKSGYVPYVDIKAFEDMIIDNYADPEDCLLCEDGDILIVCDGSRSGLVGKAIAGAVGSTLAVISAKGCSNDYLYYFLQSLYTMLNTKKKGTGTPHLNPEILKNAKLVVPPLPEQKRIVSRIEELFSQLDASVAELQAAKKRLKVYRQAVLKEAFEGKLTDAVSKGIFPIRDFIETPRYGTSKKCSYNHSDYSTPVYRIPNVDYTLGRIRHNDIKYTVFSESELEGIRLKEGDILIIRSNGSVSLVGRAAIIYNCDTKGTFAGYLMRLRIKNTEVLEPKYLLWYLQSLDARMYIENKAKSTSGVHNINSTEIAELQIPLYTHKEQLDIIKSIETRLSVCDSIELTVDTALKQAEALRQSILKQAFEGKL